MKEEVIEPVLQEMLEEIKQLTEEIKSGKKKSEDAIDLLKNFDNKLSAIKVNAPEVNFSPVNKTIEAGIFKITNVIEAQPKIIRREFHFHFFPKLNIMDYYRTYSRLVFWMTLLVLSFGLLNLSVEWIKGYNQRQDNLEQREASKQYNENDIELNVKRNKAKLPVLHDVEIIKLKMTNYKTAAAKKRFNDSLKNVANKNIQHLNDSLRK